MLREELSKALDLTYRMREAFQQDNLDEVQLLAKERDNILYDSLGGKLSADEKQVSEPFVQKIVQLNEEMIEMGQREKVRMQNELGRELHASSGVKQYIDNMKD